jgi:hypothetical protein
VLTNGAERLVKSALFYYSLRTHSEFRFQRIEGVSLPDPKELVLKLDRLVLDRQQAMRSLRFLQRGTLTDPKNLVRVWQQKLWVHISLSRPAVGSVYDTAVN